MTFVKLVQEDEFTSNDEIIHSDIDHVSCLNDDSVIKFIANSGLVINILDKDTSLISRTNERDEWKKIAVCCLNHFVSVNWFGVDPNSVAGDLVHAVTNLFDHSKCSHGNSDGQCIESSGVKDGTKTLINVYNCQAIKTYLHISDESFAGIKSLPFLALARYVLAKSDCASIWRLRYLIVHQHVLEQPNADLYLELKRTLITFEEFIKDEVTTMKQHKLKLQVAIELAQSFLWYSDIATAGPVIDSIKEFVGLVVEFDGALGKRTKYQGESKSQLILRIKRREDCYKFDDFESLLKEARADEETLDSGADGHSASRLKNVAISDDTILDQVKFEPVADKEMSDKDSWNLLPEEECYLLLLISQLKRVSSSDDELANEELSTFINYLIVKTNLWPIKFKSLYLRSLIERNSSRRVERSMIQLDHLVEAVRAQTSVATRDTDGAKNTGLKSGLKFFYTSMFDPSWVIEKHLGDTLRSMGCVKAALDIYERLGYWEDVIVCYHRLDRKDKAESIIREKIESDANSPYLWCLLGDATDQLECYEKSWSLSGSKYYKAKRAIGNHHFKSKDYELCIEPFQESLKLNSLQIDTWNRLAFAALYVEDYNLSVRAYRRYVEFEPDVFEAWNNMSKAYIKLGQKVTAYNTLQEAIKCNYDQWKLWDNYMIVALDIGSFEEVIRSYHRLIDIKRSHEDDQVIALLTDAVVNGTNDMNGNNAGRLNLKLIKLLARIGSTSYSSLTLWTSMFNLYQSTNVDIPTAEKIGKMTDCIKKGNRAIIKDPDWNKVPESCIRVIEQSKGTMELINVLLSNLVEDEDKKKLINTFKLSYLSVIKSCELACLKWDTSKFDVQKVDQLRTELESELNELVKMTIS